MEAEFVRESFVRDAEATSLRQVYRRERIDLLERQRCRFLPLPTPTRHIF